MNKILNKAGIFGNIDFCKFFTVQALSHIADAVMQFALTAVILDKMPKAGAAIALTLFSFLLPQFLLSPIAGALSDRFSRKNILALSALYRAVIVTSAVYLFIMPDNITPVNIYLTAFLTGIGSALFYPAKMAAIPNIAPRAGLKAANALSSSMGVLALLFGAYLSNCFVTAIGAGNTLLITSAAYAAAGSISLFINLKYNKKDSCAEHSLQDIKEGFKTAADYMKNHRRVLYLIMLSFCIQFIAASFSNNLNTLITDYYHLNFGTLTMLRTILGAGIITGMALVVCTAGKIKTVRVFAAGFIILFAAMFTANFCTSVSSAWLWLLPIGIADAMLVVLLDTVLQKITPDRARGKIFGLSLMINTLGFLAGTLLIAGVSGHVNPLSAFKILAAASFMLALAVLLFDKSFRYFILKALIGAPFLLLYRYKAEGLENLPKCGKVVLAGNHTGWLDTVIVQLAVKRHLWFVTGSAAFNIPVVKHILKFYNVIPLEAGKGIEALNDGVIKLNKGEAVIIFPEGKLTTTGELCKFGRGAAVMARAAGAPIVPFAIAGGFESWQWNKKFPSLFKTITIQFGQPINDLSLSDIEITKELRERVNFMKNSLERRRFYNIQGKLHTNFLDLMQEKADLYAPVNALSIKTKDGYRALTYIELSRSAKKFANYLIETIKIERGDRIAVLSESRPEFGIAVFASIQTGAVTVPLDIKLTVNEHTHILSDCTPKVLCCSSHYLNHAFEVQKNVPSIEHIFVIDDEEKQEKAQFIGNLEADTEKNLGRPRSLDETALIVYTSGTTGNPKGVMISFGNIYSQFRDFEKIFKITSKNKLLSMLPLNHLLELTDGFFAMLYMGAQVVYIKNLTPKELSAAMKEKGITNMITVPLAAKMLKNSIEKEINKKGAKVKKAFDIMYNISKYMPRALRRLMFKPVIDNLGGKLECLISGGAPLEDSTAEFFERLGVPIFQGYGLTETSPTISANYYGNSKIGTAGKPLPSVKVKLNETGELLAAGLNVMQGYWKKPEMTQEVIDEDGWFHTGGIAEIDKDGFIKITGRIKNMIVLGGGKKIFPEEVEAVLEMSDKIKEVCVLSLKIQSGSKAGTEEVTAVIVPSGGIKNKENVQEIIEEEVKHPAAENSASYKTPSRIIIHKDELPKTSTRKVKRKDLSAWCEKQ